MQYIMLRTTNSLTPEMFGQPQGFDSPRRFGRGFGQSQKITYLAKRGALFTAVSNEMQVFTVNQRLQQVWKTQAEQDVEHVGTDCIRDRHVAESVTGNYDRRQRIRNTGSRGDDHQTHGEFVNVDDAPELDHEKDLRCTTNGKHQKKKIALGVCVCVCVWGKEGGRGRVGEWGSLLDAASTTRGHCRSETYHDPAQSHNPKDCCTEGCNDVDPFARLVLAIFFVHCGRNRAATQKKERGKAMQAHASVGNMVSAHSC